MIRPRSPLVVLFWSFGLYLLIHTIQYAGCLVASLISGASFESIISGKFSNHLTLFGRGITAAVLGVPFIFLIFRFLWRRPWSWVRFQFDIKLLLSGLVAGACIATLALVAVGLFGNIEITATPQRFAAGEIAAIILGTIGHVAFIAITEELIFRGIAVREWATKWGWSVASLVGGIYFGTVHIIGLLPNVGFISAVWIILAAIVGNVLFVAWYIRGDSLWLPIGFHAGWNLSLMTLYGVTLSGRVSAYGLFTIEISGPAAITGGVFGLEASVVVMVMSVTLTVLVMRLSKSRMSSLLNSGLNDTTADAI